MSDMSVTLETFHAETSPLNEEAPLNMSDMLAIPETSHPDMLPLNREAPSNMEAASVTLPKSGASAASYAMFDASLNASFMDIHCASPHCTSAVTFAALAESSASLILLKSPDTDTLWDPGKPYAWVASPDWTVVVPSPQSTAYDPVCPPTGSVTDSLGAPVFHVVTNLPVSKMDRSLMADTGLFDSSRTAPASMSSCGDAMALAVAVCGSPRSSVMKLALLWVAMLADSVTPPVSSPASRTCILE